MNTDLIPITVPSIEDLQENGIKTAELAAACTDSCGEYVDVSGSSRECQLDKDITIRITDPSNPIRVQIWLSDRIIFDATAKLSVLGLDLYRQYECEIARRVMEEYLDSYPTTAPMTFPLNPYSELTDIEINF